MRLWLVSRRGVSRWARASGAAKRVGRARGTAGDGRSTHDHPSPAARAAPTAAQAPAPGGSRRAGTVPMHAESTVRNSTVAAEHRVICVASAPPYDGIGQGRLRLPWVAPPVMGGADAVGVGCRPRRAGTHRTARLRPSGARRRPCPMPGTIPQRHRPTRRPCDKLRYALGAGVSGYARRFLLKNSIVRCQASLAAASS